MSPPALSPRARREAPAGDMSTPRAQPPLLSLLPLLLLLLMAHTLPVVAAAAAAAGDADAELKPGMPQCDREAACYCESMPGDSFKLFCARLFNYTFRFTYVARTPISPASIVIWCDPLKMRREHFDQLFAYNMTLGAVDTVVFNLCLLPSGRLVDFLGRLGVTSLQRLRVASHAILNDTMPANFLEGINATSVQLTDVTRIELHDHFLASLGHLENLTMTGSALSVPEALFQHTPRLGRLGLTGGRMQALPAGLFDGLTQLTMLGLGKNRLRALTRRHFRDLGRLEWLDLYANKLATLPADVFAPLHRLQTLRMEDNPLHALPSELFAATPELRQLRLSGGTLSGGGLRQLPADLFRGLAKLELVMLHQMGMEQLPDTLFANLSALANLTLDRNRFESLPETVFADLSSLRNLDLRGNRLTTVPARLLHGLGSLDTLYLGSNGLSALPDDMFVSTPQLERLYLDRNNLSRLGPRTFGGRLRKLRLLQLDYNNLVLGGEGAFQQLPQLKELHLKHNRIKMIAQELKFNLFELERLDLSQNHLENITFSDLNFLSQDAKIDLRNNRIGTVTLEPTAVVEAAVTGNDRRRPNEFRLDGNPLRCDCLMVSLADYARGTGPLARHRDKLDELFRLQGVVCALPPAMTGRPLAGLLADQLLCPLAAEDCPAGCRCSEQPSQRAVLVTCGARPAGAPLAAALPRIRDNSIKLHLEGAGLQQLPDLHNTSAPISELHLSRNELTSVPVALLPPALRLLRLDGNQLTNVSEQLVDYLERTAAHVTLGDNPYECDCALLPLHSFIQRAASNASGHVEDLGAVICVDYNRTLHELGPDEVCPSRLAMVITACVVSTAFVICVLVTVVLYYNYRDTIKVWLYARGLCMSLVTEEEIDTDKKYDAFVSYSHLDEEFVVEQLAPQLERGDPKYKLCLHFRDWLAGEWITDQIQRSVQESRRVIVIMSQNFVQSEWGRLEFLAAHKHALSERRNRVILVVYGPMPDPADMDPELRTYISLNTYLQWGDPLFWERLRYALPHKGRRLKKSARRRRRLTSDKLGLILRDGGLSSTSSTPAVTPTIELPATPNGHVNNCFVGDKLATISESRQREQREQCGDNVV